MKKQLLNRVNDEPKERIWWMPVKADKRTRRKAEKKLSTSLKNSNKCLPPQTTEHIHKGLP